MIHRRWAWCIGYPANNLDKQKQLRVERNRYLSHRLDRGLFVLRIANALKVSILGADMTATDVHDTGKNTFGETSPRARVTRLTVNLPTEILDELKELAEQECVSMTEIIRRSVKAEKFLRKEIEAGNKILIQEKGESMPSRIVVFS